MLLVPGNKINRYGEQPKSGFWDGTHLVVDPLNVSIIKSKLRKLWLDLIRRTDEIKDINLNNITPMEAMLKLKEIQDKVK